MGLLVDFEVTEGAKTYSPIFHKPFEQFSPAYQIDQTYAPSVFIESPESRGAVVTTKKQATQTPEIGGSSVVAPTTGTPQDVTGTIVVIGIIAVVGWIAVSYLKKKK